MSDSNKIFLSVIVPAFNEEESLPVCLDRAIEFFADHDEVKWELIIIDDGSSDCTAKKALIYQKKHDNIRLISHTDNLGMGAAYVSGLKAARGSHAFLHPADGSFKINDSKKFVEALSAGDFVVGRRQGYREAESSVRQWISNLQTKIFSRLLNLDLENFCGVNLLPLDQLQKTPPTSNSHIATIEAVVILLESDMKMAEIPVKIYPRIAGESRIFTPLGVTKAVRDLGVTAVKRISGKYRRAVLHPLL